jgi:virginiamycin B lyase
MSSATTAASPSRSVFRRYLFVGLVSDRGGRGCDACLAHARSEQGYVRRVPDDRRPDIPAALAIGPDGAVWFSIDFSNAVGLLRDGKIQRFTKKGDNVDALWSRVDAAGNAWYADGPAVAIKISPSGEMTSFPLGTPIARLARLAVAPDGAVWFAESTSYSVTRLKDGVLTRNPIDSMRGGSRRGAGRRRPAWATLQSANALMRILPTGEIANTRFRRVGVRLAILLWTVKELSGSSSFAATRSADTPMASSTSSRFPKACLLYRESPLHPDGSVWFGAMRGGLLGRLKDGKFRLFRFPREDARPFSVASDPQGNIWYADIRGFVGMLSADQARPTRRLRARLYESLL